MARGTRNRSRFGRFLGLIALAGIALRVGYDLVVLRHLHLGIDSTWYYLEAGVIRTRHTYADPAVFATRRLPTAAWPPAYPAFLALTQSVFGDALRTSQLAGAFSGAVTIGLTGLLARRLTDDMTALLAAALVALSPLLIAVDGSMMSETLFVPLALGVALLVTLARQHGSLWLWAAAGVAVGAATLTRADGLILAVCVVLPGAALSGGSRRTRVTAAVVATVATVAILVPWVVRNAVQVDAPTISTVSSGTAIGGANCAATYGGGAIGAWDLACTHPEQRSSLDESAWSDRSLHDGLRYASGHLTRVPLVVGARIARAAGVWSPTNQAGLEKLETRSRLWQMLAGITGALVLAVGGVGIVQLARRRRPVAALVGLLAASAAVVVFGYGNTRFRAAAEPALLIGLAFFATTLARARTRATPRS